MTLGTLQELTMLAAARLGEDAWGGAIRDELRQVAGRRVSVQTVWVTLVRLEKQGLVASGEAEREPGQPGRPRRVFRITPKGWTALERTRVATASMWEGVARP